MPFGRNKSRPSRLEGATPHSHRGVGPAPPDASCRRRYQCLRAEPQPDLYFCLLFECLCSIIVVYDIDSGDNEQSIVIIWIFAFSVTYFSALVLGQSFCVETLLKSLSFMETSFQLYVPRSIVYSSLSKGTLFAPGNTHAM